MAEDLVMNRRVVWDSKHLKQIDEAKSLYRKYKAKGYVIAKADGSPLDRFVPTLEELVILAKKAKKGLMKILCSEGDRRLTWDKENGQEAKEAKAEFLKLIKEGYMALSVNSEGKKNHKIEEFDVDAEEILMVPPTAKG